MTLQHRIAPETLRERRLPVIETERLILCAPRVEDAPAVAALINDRRIAENLARVPHPYARKDAETFIASVNQKDGEISFLVTLRDGTLVGGCGVGLLAGTHPEIGYWYGVPYWGCGYATEAARAVLDYAFGSLGHAELEGGARVSNPASRRVLEKCGFQWTGVGLYRIRAINSSAPIDRFRLERGIWSAIKTWGRMKKVG